jgi:hypothetical protein
MPESSSLKARPGLLQCGRSSRAALDRGNGLIQHAENVGARAWRHGEAVAVGRSSLDADLLTADGNRLPFLVGVAATTGLVAVAELELIS